MFSLGQRWFPGAKLQCDLPRSDMSNSRLENAAEVHSEAVANAPFK